ncbi:MAG: sensor histidine kinase [Planctomycetota bacterium]
MAPLLAVLLGAMLSGVVFLTFRIVRLRRQLARTEAARGEALRQRDTETDRRRRYASVTADLLKGLKMKQRRLDLAKEHFLEAVSHELRTPLASLLASVEIVTSEGRRNPELREWLVMIEKSAGRLGEIVDRTEEMVQLESSFPKEKFQILGLDGLLRQLRDRVLPLVEESSVRCKLRWPRFRLALPGSGEHLVRLLELLIENAIRFTRKGGQVVLEGEVLLDPGGNDRILFQVFDEGPGIPDEEIPFIFDRFHQVRGEAGEKPSGLGLGLPICQSIAAALGSKIAVRKRARQGSCFSFDLECFHVFPEDRTPSAGEPLQEIEVRRPELAALP